MRTLASSDSDTILNIGLDRYVSTIQLPTDILYKDSRYYRQDKNDLSLKDTGRIVQPIPGSRPSD